MIDRDFRLFSEYLYYFLYTNTKCFGFPQRYAVNKLAALDIAQKVGLKIPNSTLLARIAIRAIF
jgi:hypothetical protein